MESFCDIVNTSKVESFFAEIYRFILACAKDIPDIRQHDENYGKTWMFFPDGDGNAQIIELNQPGASVRFTFAHENPDTKIVLWLFDK